MKFSIRGLLYKLFVNLILVGIGSPDRLWGPPSLLSNGYRRLFPGGGVKQPGNVDDQPSQTSAEVKKM
jgi:hypothetical protein